MKLLTANSSVWSKIGVEKIVFYDNCAQTKTSTRDNCPVVVCGCVIKPC